MRVHIYARVSTDAQAEKGYSLQTQVDACRKKAEDMGATLITEHIDDGYSGSTLDRPALSDLRAAVRDRQANSVICYDPDRLSRNQFHQMLLIDEFQKAGVKPNFVTVNYDETAEGKLMYNIRGAVSEFERQKIRERTMRGKRGKAQAGKIVMNVHPFGYGYDQESSMYTENNDSELVRKLFRMAGEGQSLSSVARKLNLEKVPGPKGKMWHVGTISRILHNPMYAGEAIQFKDKRDQVDGKWVTTERDPAEWIIVPCPALITREEFDKAQTAIAQNQRFSPRNTQRVYLLQNIARCGKCGRTMRIEMRGRQQYYYVCASHRLATDGSLESCGSRGIKASLLDEIVWGELRQLVHKPAKIRQLITDKKTHAQSYASLKKLHTQETELLNRQKSIMKFFTEGHIDSKTAEDSLSTINTNLVEIRKKVEDLTKMSNLRNIDDRIAGFWDAIKNIENRREACLAALQAVYVLRTDNNVGRYADTEVDIKIVPK